MNTLAKQEDTVKEALKIIYVTRPMPSHPVASHPPFEAKMSRRFGVPYWRWRQLRRGWLCCRKSP